MQPGCIKKRTHKPRSETYGLGGKGRLSRKLIDELSVYYRFAIHRNVDSVDNMYKTVWVTLYYKSSADEKPNHEYCPESAESWCSWQVAKATNSLNDYVHKPPLRADVIAAITPIYEDLSNKELLMGCLGGFERSPKISGFGSRRKFAPKTSASQAFVLQ